MKPKYHSKSDNNLITIRLKNDIIEHYTTNHLVDVDVGLFEPKHISKLKLTGKLNKENNKTA